MIRVILPQHLRVLAGTGKEVVVDPGTGPAGWCALLDALEAAYPTLRGTIRDQATGERRPFVRFFACQEDISHQPADAPLPAAVLDGAEPFHVVGAMAGG